jgi:signal transduction histidine kinase
MRFRDLKLATKQRVGFGFILIMMAAVNFFSLNRMAAMKSEIDEVTTNWLRRAIAISDLSLSTSHLRMNQLQLAFAASDSLRRDQGAVMTDLIDRINENIDIYEELKEHSEAKNLYSEDEGEIYSRFNQEWERYQDLSFSFFMLVRDNRTERAVSLLNTEAKITFRDFSTALAELVRVNRRESLDAAKRAEMTHRYTINITILLLLITFLTVTILGAGLVRLITVPIKELERAAGDVAKGQLDTRLDVASKDEIGSLSQSFNQMTAALKVATEKTKQQAEKLQAQHKELQNTHSELEVKSEDLATQKTEIEQKNIELEEAMNELKNTQEQLLLKEKMASLGHLVAGVAHEINNPIGTVSSSTDVSRRCAEKIESVIDACDSLEAIKSSEPLAKSISILKRNIEVTLEASARIADIVKSLRNFIRLDEAEYQRADLHEGIDSTLILLANEFGGRISVIKEYGDIPDIECYPGQLNQVFINLLKNAAQAIEDSGTIRIRTTREDSQVRVEISDSGRGIPPERLKNIFDFRFSADGSRVKMGSGLSTAYSIIQSHSGELKFDSEVGKGTTVSIYLPVRNSEQR